MANEPSKMMHRRKRDQRFLAWYRLLRLVKKGVGFIGPSFVEPGISRQQIDLLSAISMDEGQNQQSYAERITVTKSNVTQALDRLEESGLVMRCREGRANCRYLTESGWDVVGRITPDHDKLLHQMFAGLAPGEITQLTRILRKLEQNTE